MGFFSWLCKGCGQGIRNSQSGEQTWMYDVAVQHPDGTRVMGHYDGYGRVSGRDIVGGETEMWHRLCFENADCPDYTGPSLNDPEQGHFGAPPVHPTTKTEPEEIQHE